MVWLDLEIPLHFHIVKNYYRNCKTNQVCTLFSPYMACNLKSHLQISNYAARNDAILLVIIPALQAPDVASSRALRIARELDSEGVYNRLHKNRTPFPLHFLDIAFEFTCNVL